LPRVLEIQKELNICLAWVGQLRNSPLPIWVQQTKTTMPLEETAILVAFVGID